MFVYKSCMRLLDLPLNANARLSSFDEVRAKLNQYGLYVGDTVRVLRVAPLDGPLLVEVNGREIALGRVLAEKILVELQ
jgi:Fe2+ transport system protein FeoA